MDVPFGPFESMLNLDVGGPRSGTIYNHISFGVEGPEAKLKLSTPREDLMCNKPM